MPGETYQTLKDKYQQQSGAAVGAAMAAQAANVGGATADKEFMGGATASPGVSTNIQQQGTAENVKKLIKEREKKKEEAKEQGGIYNIQTGEIELPEEKKEKSWYEKLWSGIFNNPDISDPLERQKLKLIQDAIDNWNKGSEEWKKSQGGSPKHWVMKLIDSLTMGKYRDDDLPFVEGSLEAAEGKYPGSFTREGLDDFIRSIDPDANILGQLERHHGDIYYSFNDPQTSGGIANLAAKAALKKNADGTGYITPDGRTISLEAGKNYNNQIFAAREIASRDRASDRLNNQGYGDGSGGGGPTDPTDPTDPPPGSGNQFAVAPEGKIGFTSDSIDPLTRLPFGYQWGNFADYIPATEVNLTDMSYYNPWAATYNNGGIVQLGHGGYLDDYAAADSLMFKDPQDEEEWEYNV